MNEVTFECPNCKAEGDYEHSCPHCGWSEEAKEEIEIDCNGNI
jgi:ribosomal protein L32